MLTDYHVHLRPDEARDSFASAFSAANVERYREAAQEAGISELGVSEHIHRFRQALAVWDHPYWREQAVDDIDAYCAFVREETDLALGLEVDFVPGREDRTQNLIERVPAGLRRRLGALPRRPRRRLRPLRHLGERAQPRGGVATLLRDAGRRGPQRHVRHPRPPRPGEDVGRGASRARRRPASLLRAGARGDRRDPDRGRGLHRGAAQAGRRDLSGAGVPGGRRRDRGADRALERRASARADRFSTTSSALELLANVGVTQLAVFEGRNRRLEPLG